MIILSNGFPTNMPDSENVSQGGPANFAKLFCSYIEKRSKDRWIGVMFQATHLKEPALEKIFKFIRRDYYKLYLPKRQLTRITQASTMQDPAKILKKSIELLTNLIRQKKPDVIFLNGFGIFNWALLKAAEKTKVPVVIQHAGIWTKELDIHKSTYTKFGRKIMEEMEQDSSRLTDAEVFLNKWSKDYYRKNIAKRSNKNTYIIPLPFNFSVFKNLSVNENDSQFYFDVNKFHIGVIARWDEIKNHKLILSLAKEIKKLKLPWQVHVITSIPDLSKYQKMQNEYEKYIDVIMPTNRSGISDFCSSVDLLIQPSLFDVSPTVVLEATASNTPIAISRNVGYAGDFKKYQAKDWIFDDKASKMVGQIKKILRKPMPAAIKKHLRYAHDHERIFAYYLKLFSEMSR
jgi:glycosyltransferase involved in cell wall biosynthesis